MPAKFPYQYRKYAVVAAGIGLTGTGAVFARRKWARHLAHQAQATEPTLEADDGVLLHVESGGWSDSPMTIVFAHGFAARAQEYDAQRDVLGQHARLVLFDQRGHGSSGWGGFRSATIEQLGRDLGKVIDEHAGSGPVVLVAHSMGGMAAIALAEQRPELFEDRVVGVALLSTAAGYLARMELPDRAAHFAVRSGAAHALVWLLWFIGPAIDRVGPFRRSWGRKWLIRQLFGGQDPPFWAVSIMQDMWIKTSQAMAAAFYPAMIAYEKTEALTAFQDIPTLVLAGSEDNTIPCHRSEKLAEEIGESARLVIVPGAGHMVNLTHPQQVNEALLDLLERTKAAGSSSPGK